MSDWKGYEAACAALAARADGVDLRQLRFAQSVDMLAAAKAVTPEKAWHSLRLWRDGLFLSHTSADYDGVSNQYGSWLRARYGESLFFENGSKRMSAMHAPFVAAALLCAKAAILVISPSVAQSQWVPFEIDLILARGIPFVTIVAGATSLESIHPALVKRTRWWQSPVPLGDQKDLQRRLQGSAFAPRASHFPLEPDEMLAWARHTK